MSIFQQTEYQPFIQFNDNYLLLYYLPTSRGKKKEQNENSLKNLNKQEYNGVMSLNTRRQIRNKLQTYYTAISNQSRYILKKHEIKPTILTLTLSATQQHSDNEIKRTLLSRTIETFKYNYDVRFFYWVAEKQKNGNLHFHMLTDRYIPHKEVRDIWNNRQEKLGYITDFEKINGHRNPNSTDIEAVKNILKASNYVTKYTTKIDQQGGIEGRLHGESDKLNTIKKFTAEYDSYLSNLINQTVYHNYFERLDLDNCTIFKGNVREWLPEIAPETYKLYKEHQRVIFDHFYS